MEITNELVQSIMQTIWTSVFGVELEDGAPVVAGDGMDGDVLTSFVHIAGPWEGAFAVACPEKLARRAAASMFDMELDSVSSGEMNDALGEIANIAGGNFKALLPPGCLMSLPTVVCGPRHHVVVPMSQVTIETVYRSEGEPMVVKILKRHK